jgi:hypothetical protein
MGLPTIFGVIVQSMLGSESFRCSAVTAQRQASPCHIYYYYMASLDGLTFNLHGSCMIACMLVMFACCRFEHPGFGA